jgi:hypothetical protein
MATSNQIVFSRTSMGRISSILWIDEALPGGAAPNSVMAGGARRGPNAAQPCAGPNLILSPFSMRLVFNKLADTLELQIGLKLGV